MQQAEIGLIGLGVMGVDHRGHCKVNGLQPKRGAIRFRLCGLQACYLIPHLRGCCSQLTVMVGWSIVSGNVK